MESESKICESVNLWVEGEEWVESSVGGASDRYRCSSVCLLSTVKGGELKKMILARLTFLVLSSLGKREAEDNIIQRGRKERESAASERQLKGL